MSCMRSVMIEYVTDGTRCGLPVPRLDIDASRFWGLETRLNGDSEFSCAPESDPLVDFGLKFFTVGDNVEYPPGDDLPGPQAMRGSTWVVQEMCRARCVHARIVDPGSLSLYAPGKKKIWLGVPVCEPPKRFNVHCMPRLVDDEAAAGREEYETSATYSLLALRQSHPTFCRSGRFGNTWQSCH